MRKDYEFLGNVIQKPKVANGLQNVHGLEIRGYGLLIRGHHLLNRGNSLRIRE